MSNNEIAKMPKEPLIIFKTEADRKKQDISLMSNFFDGYINQLCIIENRTDNLQIVKNITASNISLVKEAIKKGESMIQGNIILVPDFDNLDIEVKEKLKKGIYSIGESRKVEDNLRAVILDENGIRKQDITLKRQKNIAQGISSKIETQIQLREIFNKLIEIQEMQEYQIRLDKIRDFINPFLKARDIIVLAETENNLEIRRNQYLKADDYIDDALTAIYSDIDETSKQFVKCLTKPIARRNKNKFMKFIIEEFQIATKYVGVQMQLLEYLGNDKKAKNILDKYSYVIKELFTLPRTKNRMSLADLFQDYYPYDKSNKNMWYNLKEEYIENQKLLNSSIDSEKDIYIISFDKESEADNNEE